MKTTRDDDSIGINRFNFTLRLQQKLICINVSVILNFRLEFRELSMHWQLQIRHICLKMSPLTQNYYKIWMLFRRPFLFQVLSAPIIAELARVTLNIPPTSSTSYFNLVKQRVARSIGRWGRGDELATGNFANWLVFPRRKGCFNVQPPSNTPHGATTSHPLRQKLHPGCPHH